MTSRFNNNRKTYFSALTPLILAVLMFFMNFSTGFAAELPVRSVTLGTSKASAVTTYQFKFSTATTVSLGSIVLEFCSNSPQFNIPCTPPVGLDLNSAILTAQTGITGFGIDPSITINKIILARSAVMTPPTAASYTFSNIVNPSALQSYFVRLSTHASTDGSGIRVDDGAVVFSIDKGIGTSAFVPPFLILCVGVAVAQNCSSTAGSLVTMGELSSATAKTATTQFSLATNDVLGFVSFVTGTTMTSGNNVIPALTSPSPSNPGTSQFGINLRANSNPSSGSNPSGAGTGVPTAGYNTPNLFKFQSGDAIASSVNSTDFTRFTVTYLTNIASGQAAGHYTTTMTYIAVVQF